MDAPLPDMVNSEPPAGLLLVDDHELIRLGLRTLVQSHVASMGGVIQVFEARTLRDAMALYELHRRAIGVVLLDLHLPDAHGLIALTLFLGRFPDARVIVLSGISDPALMRDALKAGASAYLTKSGDLQQVVAYIRSQGLLHRAGLPGPAGPPAPGAEPAGNGSRVVVTAFGDSLRLTARQSMVLDAILAGRSNREIAAMANLTEGTVKNHVSSLLLMFGVRSRAQLISQQR